MTKAILAGGFAALILTAVAGGAVAQQAQGRPDRAMRADSDGDGRVSQAEFVGRRVERLTAADADRDGSVTREEMRVVAQARRAERLDVRFERLDADDNGAVSRAEFAALAEARGGPGRTRAGWHRHGRAMGRHAGRDMRAPIVIADVGARAEQGFARLDADNDGYVTADEGRAGLRSMRERRRDGRAARPASPTAPASASE